MAEAYEEKSEPVKQTIANRVDMAITKLRSAIEWAVADLDRGQPFTAAHTIKRAAEEIVREGDKTLWEMEHF